MTDSIVGERELAELLFENSLSGVALLDESGLITLVNPAFCAITGYDAGETIGQNLSFLSSLRNENGDASDLLAKCATEEERSLWFRRKGGEAFPARVRLKSMVDGADTRRFVLMIDRDYQSDPEGNVAAQTNLDPLTGLPNRALFLDRLGAAISRSKRSGSALGVFFLDLDNFKNVNDSLGHEAGDALLIEAAKRLQGCIREVDTPARLGGDEFTVILENLAKDFDVTHVARKIIKSLSKAYHLCGEDVYITVSLGVTLFPDDGADASALLRNADLAMYHAKELGKNNFQIFNEGLNERAIKRIELEKDLRHAIVAREMVMYLQPKVSLATNQVVGMEALMRWRKEDGSLVSPGEFIPLAEETGLIIQLDEWMLGQVCEFIGEMHRLNIDNYSVSVNVSVNLSAVVLERKDLVATIKANVARLGLEPRHVELEVTESSIIKNIDLAIDTIQRLRDAGFNVSMDDFGTGYSSLSYLTKLPINILKIDKAFVTDLPGDRNSCSVARAIVQMAHEMNMKVIAEGVEEVEQLDFLRSINCNEIQGFLFSRPLPKEEMKELLLEKRELVV